MHNPLTPPCLACLSSLLSLILALLLDGLAASSHAQIIVDDRLGPRVPLTGPDFIIPAEMGQQHGSNLFHSFELFNIHLGESATFTGPDSVQNVIGRVTGLEPSIIDGLLRSDIPGAKLFLFNPHGIFFGPHATLDVSGSFYVSTANRLRFADGVTFEAGSDNALTAAAPAAFGFTQGSSPAPIRVDGSHLEVPEGETLSIIGGNIVIQGDALSDFGDVPTLDAPGGRIHLVSAASLGEVEFDSAGVRVDDIDTFGTVTISDGALLSTSGERGGTVVIRGGDLVVDSSDIFADTLGDRDGAEVGIDIGVTGTFVHTHGGFITADSFGAGHAGDIRITADILRMDHEALIASGAFADGNAGNINVEATNVILTSGAQIESATFDLGQGGTVTVRASETVMLTGTTSDGIFPSAIRAETLGAGDAGNTLVEAQTVMLIGGGTIGSTTLGPGHEGSVTVRASGSLILIGTGPDGTVPSSITASSLGLEGHEIGDGGNVLVEARRVEITAGAQISSETISTGRGGQ